MANTVNLNDAINATIIIMENIKAYGLIGPVALDTYVYYAGRLEYLLNLKMETNPSTDTIEQLCFARGEIFSAMRKLKAFEL